MLAPHLPPHWHLYQEGTQCVWTETEASEPMLAITQRGLYLRDDAPAPLPLIVTAFCVLWGLPLNAETD